MRRSMRFISRALIGILLFGGLDALGQFENVEGDPFSLEKTLELLKSPLLPARKRTYLTTRGVRFQWSAELQSQLTRTGATADLIGLVRQEADKHAQRPAGYRNYWLARDYYEAGRWAEAASAATESLADPESRELHWGAKILRAICRMNQNEGELALEDLEELRSQSNSVPPIFHILAGHALRSLGRFEEALAEYNQAVEMDQDRPGPRLGRGLAFARLERYPEAIADFSFVIEKEPDNVQALSARAEIYQETGSLQNAWADRDRIVGLQPKAPWSYINRGNASVSMGNPAAAESDFTKAVELGPGDASALISRGLFLMQNARPKEALRDLEKALTINPKDAGAHYFRTETLLRMADLPRALNAANEMVGRLPDFGLGYERRAHIQERLGKDQQALVDYERAIALSREPGTELLFRKCFTLNRLKRHREAVACYDDLISREPTNAVAFNNRADALNLMGDYAKGLSDANKSLELAPGEHITWTTRAESYVGLRRYAEAIEDTTKALSLQPDYPHGYRLRADAREALGDHSGALADRKRADELEGKVRP